MRIRKQASKLLGWAYCLPFPSSSSPPRSAAQYSCPAHPPEAYSGELQCQINRSPWDAFEDLHCTNSQEDFGDQNDEAEETSDVLQKEFEVKKEDGVDVEVKAEEEHEDEKLFARTSGEKETEETRAVTKCKKTDGKGWHCKRAAQLPHSLCSYHLAQLRSYRARFVGQVSGGRNNRRKKTAVPFDAGGGTSNSYYYYSILGPWWGKRRAPVDGNENSESNDEHTDKNDHGTLASADDNDDDNRNYKKKRPSKKRGRKPVKARSLKSLL